MMGRDISSRLSTNSKSGFKYKVPGREDYKLSVDMPTHAEALKLVLATLVDEKLGVIKSVDEIGAVGHRVLHGGDKLSGSVLVTEEAKAIIEECCDLGPLHNPANLKGIIECEKIMSVPQVAVFDTGFHGTMPDYAYMYALPYEYYEKYKIRRYGFHGTSHRFVSGRAIELLGKENSKIVTCHLGNGASLSAVVDGKCVDTTRGLTPLEGLMMGTRSGDIDPGAISFIMDKLQLDSKGLSDLLNKKSGVLGVSGVSSDMREVDAAEKEGNYRAKLANTMYYYRIKKYIGAYAAAMGGVDIIVFAGGVGENQIHCRAAVLEGLEFLGIELDPERNKIRGEEAILSSDASKVKVVLVPTDEELMIASDTYEIISAK